MGAVGERRSVGPRCVWRQFEQRRVGRHDGVAQGAGIGVRQCAADGRQGPPRRRGPAAPPPEGRVLRLPLHGPQEHVERLEAQRPGSVQHRRRLGPSTAGFQVEMGNAVVDRLKKSPLVGNVDFRAMGNDVNIPVALQNFNTFISQGVDLIIAEPLLGPSFVPVAKKAAAAGIPVVTVQTAIDTPEAVNVSSNLTLAYAQSTARLLRIIGGKGNVLAVRGIPGSPPDVEADAAWKKVLAECPNVKRVGDVYGNFIDVNAKSETLKYLATHPQKIEGVVQSGTMTGGIMGAFQQSGRPMPVVDDVGPMKASTGYWLQHRGTYHGVGMAFGPQAMGSAGADVALRILEGQGPKVSNIVDRMQILTEDNLDQWGDKSWSLTTPGQPEGPAGWFFTDDYINAFFARPATPKGS